MAAINLTASMYEAAFPAMILSKTGGNEIALGIVNAVTGVAMLIGSVLTTFCLHLKAESGLFAIHC